jgi:hypothetical protein
VSKRFLEFFGKLKNTYPGPVSEDMRVYFYITRAACTIKRLGAGPM